jgi:hypothetical protein
VRAVRRGGGELEAELVSVKEPRSDDSVTDRLRFLMALCLVALGAAAFAIAFRSSLTLWYRMVLGAGNVGVGTHA